MAKSYIQWGHELDACFYQAKDLSQAKTLVINHIKACGVFTIPDSLIVSFLDSTRDVYGEEFAKAFADLVKDIKQHNKEKEAEFQERHQLTIFDLTKYEVQYDNP